MAKKKKDKKKSKKAARKPAARKVKKSPKKSTKAKARASRKPAGKRRKAASKAAPKTAPLAAVAPVAVSRAEAVEAEFDEEPSWHGENDQEELEDFPESAEELIAQAEEDGRAERLPGREEDEDETEW